jgi:nicastrin
VGQGKSVAHNQVLTVNYHVPLSKDRQSRYLIAISLLTIQKQKQVQCSVEQRCFSSSKGTDSETANCSRVSFLSSPIMPPLQRTTTLPLLQLLLIVCATSATFDQPFNSLSDLKHAPCVSLFYRNGRMGCSTDDRSVEAGKLIYYQGSFPNTQQDFVAVVEDYDLTAETVNSLLTAKGGLLKGILVLNSTSTDASSKRGSSAQSPSLDRTMPQGYGSPSANVNYGYTMLKWNANGQGLLDYDLHGVPMAYVQDSDAAQSVREGALGNSGSVPSAVVAEFDYYMGPENMTSIECLSWKDISNGEWSPKCLPLGGTSVWATAGSPPNPGQNGRKASSQRPVLLFAAGMDSTSLFHDVSPGSNTAASNILTMLMAAKLIGSNVFDQALNQLPNRLVFALFQGESYGFVGSRSFLRDVTSYPGFQCKGQPVKSVSKQGASSEYGCLNPLRPSLKFADLGQIAGMLSVDQVGRAVADGTFYYHADENHSFSKYMAYMLKNVATSTFSVVASSVYGNNNGDGSYPYPPSPLTSLLQLSSGNLGGVVLTGYDYQFTNKVPYHSPMESAKLIDLDTIAAAATIVARTAYALAMDDGTYMNYATPTAAAKSLIPELASDDASLVELAHCLLYDGNCDLIKKYSAMETANENFRTGWNTESADPLGTPPSFYVGVCNGYYGQPYVAVGNEIYGAYNGSDFGKQDTDAISSTPRQLESAVRGLFNDFLGRGSMSGSNGDSYLSNCKKLADCAKVEYCGSYGDTVTCTGSGKCVCKRAHYHVALDEALLAAENKPTGYFEINANDKGISPIYTEPFWSSKSTARLVQFPEPSRWQPASWSVLHLCLGHWF